MGTVASRLKKLAAAGLPVAPLPLSETDDAARDAPLGPEDDLIRAMAERVVATEVHLRHVGHLA